MLTRIDRSAAATDTTFNPLCQLELDKNRGSALKTGVTSYNWHCGGQGGRRFSDLALLGNKLAQISNSLAYWSR